MGPNGSKWVQMGPNESELAQVDFKWAKLSSMSSNVFQKWSKWIEKGQIYNIFLYFSAGEWFKEELRELGGLDHLVKTMSDCVGFLMADEISVWTEQLQNKLRKAGRVLKVLESVSTRFHEFF